MTATEGFPKYERICKDNDIQNLFHRGVGVSVYPYRAIFRFFTDDAHPPTCRLLISVAKKRFHHAFKRNRIKRLIREAWRKNKAGLIEMCQRDNISVDVALVYTATVIHSYKELLAKTKKTVQEIAKHHEKHSQTAR